MKILSIRSRRLSVPLSQPYAISSRLISSTELFVVEIDTDEGVVGLGAGAPAEEITGESADAAEAALTDGRLETFEGGNPRRLGGALRLAGDVLSSTPAAHAAVDMALWDLFARLQGLPLVDVLGRRHQALPTSVTLGVDSVAETLEQARAHLKAGFRCLKVKVGRTFDEDEERLRRLREAIGQEIRIRIDANEGYSLEETARLEPLVKSLDLELVEQPLPATEVASLHRLPEGLRRLVAVDENLHGPDDALALAGDPAPCGIYNIKLMKCGGVTPALSIASIAELARRELMWGCMDESVISIAAALHAAYACPATRYIDLDGSFDLAEDPAIGGFAVDDGCLRTLDAPGLGVSLG